MTKEIEQFVIELNGFAEIAEKTLEKIESDLMKHRALFSVFSNRMLTIRGTAQQLKLSNISHIAGLAEEIAIKGTGAETRPQVRKCVGSLWDALTTVKYLLEHPDQETSDEQKILINRLEYTLKAFGGARESLTEEEIAKLTEEIE